MKTIIIVIALLCCGIAQANDWDVLQYDLNRITTGQSDGPRPQSSMDERYDPQYVVCTDSTPRMPDTITSPYE